LFALIVIRQEEAEQLLKQGLQVISEGYSSSSRNPWDWANAKFEWWDCLVKFFFKQEKYQEVCGSLHCYSNWTLK
jgi:hypothetical protein